MTLITSLATIIRDLFRPELDLALENMALRQQLGILKDKKPRPKLRAVVLGERHLMLSETSQLLARFMRSYALPIVSYLVDVLSAQSLREIELNLFDHNPTHRE